MKYSLHALTLLVSFALTACGGGGSSDSGGGSDPAALAGNYSSISTINISAAGSKDTVVGAQTFEVESSGTIRYVENGTVYGGAKLSGNAFRINIRGNVLNTSGLSCGGSIVYSGAISGSSISGKVSSSALQCNGVPVTLTGSFKGSKTARALKTGSLKALSAALQ